MNRSKYVVILFVVAAFSSSICGSFSVKEAEAITIREALSWLKTRQWQHVILVDAQQVVFQLRLMDNARSSLGLILDDCRVLLSDFACMQIRFVCRSANEVAKAACSLSGFYEWGSLPTFFFF